MDIEANSNREAPFGRQALKLSRVPSIRIRDDTPIELLLSQTGPSDDDCIIWRGPYSRSGTPMHTIGTDRRHAVRWLLEQMGENPVPHCYRLERTCRTFGCVNTLHYSLTTAGGTHRLHAADILDIVKRCHRGEKRKDVAARYGVSLAFVDNTLAGIRHAAITGIDRRRNANLASQL